MIELYQKHPYLISYDRKQFDFRSIIQEILEESNLEELHTRINYTLFERSQDQSTAWHKKYYERFELFDRLYKKFIADHVKPLFGVEKLVCQRIPTFRVHLVGNIAVGEWHKDRAYNHGSTEVNLWMPFTDTFGNNTIWTESEEDKGDYEPYAVKQGEILVFDGANLNHGNKINDTDTTRVSVDFRVVDFNKFRPSEKGSINNNTRFDIGGYFDVV